MEKASVSVLILAIFFGILQYIPSNKIYSSIIPEALLKVISITFFSIVLLPFLIYFLLVAINMGEGMKGIIPKKLIEGIYNFVMLTTLLIVFITVGYGLIINIVIIFPAFAKTGGYLLIIFLLLTGIAFVELGRKYIFRINQQSKLS